MIGTYTHSPNVSLEHFLCLTKKFLVFLLFYGVAKKMRKKNLVRENSYRLYHVSHIQFQYSVFDGVSLLLTLIWSHSRFFGFWWQLKGSHLLISNGTSSSRWNSIRLNRLFDTLDVWHIHKKCTHGSTQNNFKEFDIRISLWIELFVVL